MSNSARLQLGFSPLSKTIMLAKMRDVEGGRMRVGNVQVVMLPMRLLNWCGDWSWLKVVRSRGSWMMVLAWC